MSAKPPQHRLLTLALLLSFHQALLALSSIPPPIHPNNNLHAASDLSPSPLAASAAPQRPEVYRRRFLSPGQAGPGELVLLQGDEPADAVRLFAAAYGLSDPDKRTILDAVCSEVPCSRMSALIYNTRVVDSEGSLLGELEIFEGEEPADVARDFVLEHNLTEDYRTAAHEL